MANKKSTSAKTFIITGITALGLFGIYKLFAKGNAINQIRTDISNIRLGFKNTAVQINIELLITNPTSETLQFKSFVGKVFLDSQPVGSIDIPNPVSIPNGTTKVPLLATIPITSLTRTFMSVLFEKQMPTKGIIDGIVKIGNLQLPVYNVFNFTIPKAS